MAPAADSPSPPPSPTTRPKILVPEKVSAEGLALLKTLYEVDTRTGLSAEDVLALIPSYHGLIVRSDAHDILFQNFVVEAQTLHGISLDARSMGIVWSRGVLKHGTFDTQRGLPVDVIRTQITLANDGEVGGDATSGPHYTRFGGDLQQTLDDLRGAIEDNTR